MEEQDKKQVVKTRSAAACIREGFGIIANHPAAMLSGTWPWIVLISLAILLYLAGCVSLVNHIMAGGQPGPWMLAKVALGLLLVVACSYFLEARVMLIMRHLRDNGTMVRIGPFRQLKPTLQIALNMLPFVVVLLVLSALLGTLWGLVLHWASSQQSFTLMVTIAVAAMAAALLAVVFLLPLIQTFYAYSMDGGNFFKTLRSTYSKGLRHVGKLLAVNLLSVILVELLMLVVSLPLVVLAVASLLSGMGVWVMGDASGMPSYMGWLWGATSVVCISLASYCYLALLSSNLFAYGAIEAAEVERMKYKPLETARSQELSNMS